VLSSRLNISDGEVEKVLSVVSDLVLIAPCDVNIDENPICIKSL